MKRFALTIGLILFASAALAADPSVIIKSFPGTVPALADSNGMALYYFKKDSVGKSACDEACTQNWPVFYSEKIIVNPPLKTTDFGVITRADGKKQTSFKGFPLYYFAKDTSAEKAKGNTFNSLWFVVDPDKFPPK